MPRIALNRFQTLAACSLTIDQIHQQGAGDNPRLRLYKVYALLLECGFRLKCYATFTARYSLLHVHCH